MNFKTKISNLDKDELQKYYTELTNAISKYSNHERDVWIEINKRNDPNFARNQQVKSYEQKSTN